jgi:hypothetical protein
VKLLIVTSVLPSKNNSRIKYIKTISEQLRKKTNTKIVWLVNQPDRIEIFDNEFESIRDIHEFQNGLDAIKLIKPDMILVSLWTDVIQYSISLAANSMQIPIIAFAGAKLHSTRKVEKVSYNVKRRFFSNTVPTDSLEQKQFLRRGRFQFFKFLFSLKTRIAINTGFFKSLIISVNELFLYIFSKQLPPNPLPLCYLLHNNSEIKPLIDLNVTSDKLIVVGNPLLDHIKKKSFEYKFYKKNPDTIKLLIVTDSLYQHGIWSSKQRDTFFNNLFKELTKNKKIHFDFKIHPASENKDYYEKIIFKSNIHSQVFQSEDLWNIIDQYDIVLTYGLSTSHTEISYSGMRMIKIYDIGVNLPDSPLVEEGILSGHVQKCNDFNDLVPMILDFMNIEPKLSPDFIKSREQLFYKHDGHAAKRIADIILKELN